MCVKTDERNEDGAAQTMGTCLFSVFRVEVIFGEAGFVSNTLAWTFGKTLNGNVRV